MKINIDARVTEALESGVTFDEQLSTAKASGKKFQIAVNAQTGDKAVVYSTDEEATRIFDVKVKPKKWRVELDAIRAELEALKKK